MFYPQSCKNRMKWFCLLYLCITASNNWRITTGGLPKNRILCNIFLKAIRRIASKCLMRKLIIYSTGLHSEVPLTWECENMIRNVTTLVWGGTWYVAQKQSRSCFFFAGKLNFRRGIECTNTTCGSLVSY